MSTDENKLLVRRYLEEVVNTGDTARLAEFITADYTEVHAGCHHRLGLAGAEEHVRGVRRVYPDLRVTVERQIAEGDWVATLVTARGTHGGEWMGMAPTGKAVEMTAVNLDRIAGGRIVEHGGAASLLEPLLAIGAVRAVGEGDGPSGTREA